MQENFTLDYFSVDWNSLINNDKHVNLSFNNFFKRTNAILDNHAPLRKVTKKKLRLRSKPWITLGLQKSISIKYSLFVKFIKSNDINQRNEMHIKYKLYRNLISTLLERSKCLYFTKIFNDNLNNLKNTWKGIKNLISLKMYHILLLLPHTIIKQLSVLLKSQMLSTIISQTLLWIFSPLLNTLQRNFMNSSLH